MRIVIDLQAAQSTGSRNRGIGRYSMSLAKAMVRNRGNHEIFLALNGHFPETIEPIRAAFDGMLPQENIRVWHGLAPAAFIDATNDWRRRSTEFVREAFLASLRPDVVHVSSLMEGLVDDAVTSVGAMPMVFPTAVTLYDLIPYIHRKPYLEDPAVEGWYLEKIENLRRADLWLTISESSRREGIEYLGLPDEWSVNISTDADLNFHVVEVSPERKRMLLNRYGLSRRFVMYTGGIDHRKNVEGLIRAYASLPADVRDKHQLAIVCSVQQESKRRLEQYAAQHGLRKDDFVLTGFVSEEDLICLYNLCALFVFPSWHEGFGLPALEAMRCGAPVIGANTSSLPEVIGWEEALFDPYSDEAIASAIRRALLDADFCVSLVENGKAQADKFSWDESARRAITAMEQLHAEHGLVRDTSVREGRPKLAFVSPLPPERSGIADYSVELLPELARLYDISVIVNQEEISDSWIKANCNVYSVQWFLKNYIDFDRVLYHFGNSAFHQHMFDMLRAIPGVVVLHDFYLSGVAYHMEGAGIAPGYFTRELYESHGYSALHNRFHINDVADVIWKYPCSLNVIQNSLGVIVHSPNSLRLAKLWYGGDAVDWAVIPLLRNPRVDGEKGTARKKLGYADDDFVVCSFGMLGPTKLNQRLLDAWLKSRLAQNGSCHLIFVGENHSGDYGRDLIATIERNKSMKNVHITGWVDADTFRHYLAAADVGVQLRTLSRGETSAAVLDCMNYGLATIVNANGSMADLDDAAVLKLSDEFSEDRLVEALERLWEDGGYRQRLGDSARTIVRRTHSPQACAIQYGEAIEAFYRSAFAGLSGLMREIAEICCGRIDDAGLIQLSRAIARNCFSRNRPAQLLVDISGIVESGMGMRRTNERILLEWLTSPLSEYRIEPVYFVDGSGYHYARDLTSRYLGATDCKLQDEPVDCAPGDIFFGFDMPSNVSDDLRECIRRFRRDGLRVKIFLSDQGGGQIVDNLSRERCVHPTQFSEAITDGDCVTCVTREKAEQLVAWLGANGGSGQSVVPVRWAGIEKGGGQQSASRSVQERAGEGCGGFLLQLVLGDAPNGQRCEPISAESFR